MVWGAVSLDGLTELVALRGACLMAVRYITDILEPHIIPYGPLIDPNFPYMHDDTRPHIARVV